MVSDALPKWLTSQDKIRAGYVGDKVNTRDCRLRLANISPRMGFEIGKLGLSVFPHNDNFIQRKY